MDRINNTKLHKMKKTLLLRKYVTIFLIDFGILLRPQRKGVMIIEESEWHYPFFNCDFLRTIMSQVLAVLRSGYTPYIKLNNRKEDETNWDTFFAQPFNTSLNADECQKIGYLPSTCSYSYYFQTPFHKHHYKRTATRHTAETAEITGAIPNKYCCQGHSQFNAQPAE